MAQPQRITPVESIDPIWARLRSEAEDREALLDLALGLTLHGSCTDSHPRQTRKPSHVSQSEVRRESLPLRLRKEQLAHLQQVGTAAALLPSALRTTTCDPSQPQARWRLA